MKLSANLIRSFNNINSWSFGNWDIRANESETLYFQIVDLDQKPWPYTEGNTYWPGLAQIPAGENALRYLTGQNGNTPVVVTVTFPTLNCNAALIITATAVSSADASLFMVSLTNLQVPGSGNVLFTVTEGSNTRNFTVMDAISVENTLNSGQC